LTNIGTRNPAINKAQEAEKSLQNIKRIAKNINFSGKSDIELQILTRLKQEQAYYHILMGGFGQLHLENW